MAKRKAKRAPTRAKRRVARASWSGSLRFGLVPIPVQAINARDSEQGQVAFHQLHATCHSRIRYEKVCPIHGPVSNDEIISAYEESRGQYVEVTDEERESLRSDGAKSFVIDHVIHPEEIDMIYLDGRMYFLTPDGDEARESFSIFLEALKDEGLYGVGRIVFSGREQIALVRPHEDVLHMALLHYAAELRSPDEVAVELPHIKASSQQMRLAHQLLDTLREEELDFAAYIDHYAEQVRELIEAKVQGREVVSQEAEEEGEVINLTEALRQSLVRARQKRGPVKAAPKRPARRRRSAS